MRAILGGNPMAEPEGEEVRVGAGLRGAPPRQLSDGEQRLASDHLCGDCRRGQRRVVGLGAEASPETSGMWSCLWKGRRVGGLCSSAAPASAPSGIRGDRSQVQGQKGQGSPRACVRLQLERSPYWRLQSGSDTSTGSISSSERDEEAAQVLPGTRPRGQLPAHTFHLLPKQDFSSPLPRDGAFCLQFSSVAQSCPTLCDPVDCSRPGLPVHHQLPEFTQTHVH